MSEALLLEDGTGVTGANTYVTVAEADDYIEHNIHAYVLWTAQSTPVKEHILMWCTRYIESRMKWEGTKVDTDLTLGWPRDYAFDHEQTEIANTTIPIRLKNAVMELARFLLASDLGDSLPQAGIDRLVVDVIEIFFTEGYSQVTIPPDVWLMLSDLGSIINPAGHTFGRIRRS